MSADSDVEYWRNEYETAQDVVNELRAELAATHQEIEHLRARYYGATAASPFRTPKEHWLNERAEEAGASIARVKALHQPYKYMFGLVICTTCGDESEWPCATIRALEGATDD